MNINKVILGGRLTRDIELRFTHGGTAVANVGFACNRRIKRNEEWIQEPVFVEVTMFGKRAEALEKHLKKGDPVVFMGELAWESWEDKETHAKRSKLKVIADEFEFVGAKSGQPSGEGPAF